MDAHMQEDGWVGWLVGTRVGGAGTCREAKNRMHYRLEILVRQWVDGGCICWDAKKSREYIWINRLQEVSERFKILNEVGRLMEKAQ